MQTGALFFVAGLVLCVAERCTDGVIRKRSPVHAAPGRTITPLPTRRLPRL